VPAQEAGLCNVACKPNRIPRQDYGMQIAQIAPLTEAIPPKLYGGTERVSSWKWIASFFD